MMPARKKLLLFLTISSLLISENSSSSISETIGKSIVAVSEKSAEGLYHFIIGPCGAPQLDSNENHSNSNPQSDSERRLAIAKDVGLLGEGAFFATLAEQREKSLQCDLSQLRDVRIINRYREVFEADLAGKISILFGIKKQMSELEYLIEEDFKLGKLPKPGTPEGLRSTQYSQLIIAAEITTSAIPLIQIPDVQDFVKAQMALFNEGRGPQPSPEELLKSIKKQSQKTLALGTSSLQSDIESLRQGVRSNGKSLSQVQKESLAQDDQLMNSFLKSHPELGLPAKNMLCRVDAKYRTGAQWRDRLVLLASIGFTVSFVGLSRFLAATAPLGAETLMIPSNAGSLSRFFFTALRIGSMITDISMFTTAIERSCGQNHAKFSTKNSLDESCSEFDLVVLREQNCLMTVAVAALGAAASTNQGTLFLRQVLPTNY